MTATALLVLFLPAAVGQGGQPFQYRGDDYLMDPFSTLFGSTPVGLARKALFDGYLQNSAEGRQRVSHAHSSDPATVWATLDVEERTTFLVVTASSQILTTDQNDKVLAWFVSLDQIHGSTKPFVGGEYDNNEAFRVYAHLIPRATAHVLASAGTFTNARTTKTFGYGGAGSRHPDFCRLPTKFDDEGKTDNAPNLQFNVTSGTNCADVDLDYDSGPEHFTKDNSNVLAHANANFHTPHLKAFAKQYGDPGFRRR
jgi:hypothetical protein